jgi:hypothetical protein
MPSKAYDRQRPFIPQTNAGKEVMLERLKLELSTVGGKVRADVIAAEGGIMKKSGLGEAIKYYGDKGAYIEAAALCLKVDGISNGLYGAISFIEKTKEGKNFLFENNYTDLAKSDAEAAELRLRVVQAAKEHDTGPNLLERLYHDTKKFIEWYGTMADLSTYMVTLIAVEDAGSARDGYLTRELQLKQFTNAIGIAEAAGLFYVAEMMWIDKAKYFDGERSRQSVLRDRARAFLRMDPANDELREQVSNCVSKARSMYELEVLLGDHRENAGYGDLRIAQLKNEPELHDKTARAMEALKSCVRAELNDAYAFREC